MIILYSDSSRGKRRRAEEGSSQSFEEGKSKVPNTEAPARKKRKLAATRPSTQGQKKDTEPEAPRGKRKRAEEEDSQSVGEGTSKFPHNEAPPAEPDSFKSRYVVGDELGQGGFGSVYKGSRISDGLQVAIKFVSKRKTSRFLYSPVESKAVPAEVALMQIMSQPPICNNIVQLIEWFDEPQRYILIQERPDPCMDLESFLKKQGNCMDEDMARDIMVQVVEAVNQCSKRGVLHRDIKLQNLLINIDTLEVKLIDFGCGDLIKTTPYDRYAGTFRYCPPEFLVYGSYDADPATVWSLGVLLFRMVYGHLPFASKFETIVGIFVFKDGLSKECRNLIAWCLEWLPSKRPSLQQIRQHEWLQCTIQT
ncbi:serine/threonine-protein kinase pim-1-like [Pygocentrus nattereri]|uniref:serine/threonine-protein kinase pim-1-like n=1 Tax=Pygocentrus nattereri TaxID=42514 RepID=UPI0008147B56|nr:serine/threonine-protein kinase pim-1-like [Pygocentrus nattereri]